MLCADSLALSQLHYSICSQWWFHGRAIEADHGALLSRFAEGYLNVKGKHEPRRGCAKLRRTNLHASQSQRLRQGNDGLHSNPMFVALIVLRNDKCHSSLVT